MCAGRWCNLNVQPVLLVTCKREKTEGRVPILSLFFPLLPFSKSFSRSASTEVWGLFAKIEFLFCKEFSIKMFVYVDIKKSRYY